MITLAKALDLLKTLKSERLELIEKSIEPLESRQFRGETFLKMDTNRLLYFIGTNAVIIESINALSGDARAYAAKHGQLDYLVETVQMMRAYIAHLAKREILNDKIDALYSFMAECDEKEIKKIRKEEKISTLKELGIIKL